MTIPDITELFDAQNDSHEEVLRISRNWMILYLLLFCLGIGALLFNVYNEKNIPNKTQTNSVR